MRYAQIDATGLCTATLETSGTIDAPHMIALAENEPWPLGMVWDGEAWQDAPAPPFVAPQVSRAEALALYRGDEFIRTLVARKEFEVLTTEQLGAAQQDTFSRAWWLVVMTAYEIRMQEMDPVNMGHPDVQTLVSAQQALGIIQTQARADAILSGTPPF